MRYSLGAILTIGLSLLPSRAFAVCDEKLGTGIRPSDCNEALILVHSFITKIKFPGLLSFTRNTRDDPADLPHAFTPPGTCAISVDIEGRNKGPIPYTWERHKGNLRALLNGCVSGILSGTGGYLAMDGFQYTVLNPSTPQLNLPSCFRPAFPADLDVVQCILGEYYILPAPALPRESHNRGINPSPTGTSETLALGRNLPPGDIGTPATGNGLTAGVGGALGGALGGAPAAGLGGPAAPALEIIPAAGMRGGSTNGEQLAANSGQQEPMSNRQERTPLRITFKCKQGNSLWTNWAGTESWYNSNGYLRIGNMDGANPFPETPFPNMESRKMYLALGNHCRPVSGIWVWTGVSWVPEQQLIDLTNERKHMVIASGANMDESEITLILELKKDGSNRMGATEYEILERGGWIVVRGPTVEQRRVKCAKARESVLEQGPTRRQRGERPVTEDDAAGSRAAGARAAGAGAAGAGAAGAGAAGAGAAEAGDAGTEDLEEDNRQRRMTRATTAKLTAAEALLQLPNTPR